MEAVLYKKYIDKRRKAYEASVNGNSSKSGGAHYAKCQFTEGGVKCAERCLPSCKFCRKHVLEDKKQILFRACGVEKAGISCQDPIPSIFEDSTCVLHIKIAEQKAYTRKKYESESDDEEETMDVSSSTDVKVETDVTIKLETSTPEMKEEPAT
ncbi:KANSL2 family protein [Megaselia abdita]